MFCISMFVPDLRFKISLISVGRMVLKSCNDSMKASKSIITLLKDFRKSSIRFVNQNETKQNKPKKKECHWFPCAFEMKQKENMLLILMSLTIRLLSHCSWFWVFDPPRSSGSSSLLKYLSNRSFVTIDTWKMSSS